MQDLAIVIGIRSCDPCKYGIRLHKDVIPGLCNLNQEEISQLSL